VVSIYLARRLVLGRCRRIMPTDFQPVLERLPPERAGAILVPAAKAKVAAIRGIDPSVVAYRYQVSIEMAQWRMKMSGGYTIRERSRSKWGRD